MSGPISLSQPQAERPCASQEGASMLLRKRRRVLKKRGRALIQSPPKGVGFLPCAKIVEMNLDKLVGTTCNYSRYVASQ